MKFNLLKERLVVWVPGASRTPIPPQALNSTDPAAGFARELPLRPIRSWGRLRRKFRAIVRRFLCYRSPHMARLLYDNVDGSPREITLGNRDVTIGRESGNEIVLGNPRTSRQHAVIRSQDDGTYQIVDLGSANGTMLNSNRLRMPATLHDQDVVSVGKTQIIFSEPRAVPKPAIDSTAQMSTAMAATSAGSSLIGAGPAMSEVFRLAEKAALSPIAVLIEGETGTGKELFAQAIHASSPRARAPFLPVNCAALPESLIESELFGHRRGAFTGAHQDRKGIFEAASGGTIFLDEIGEMPAAMQPKLLRVLQEGAVTPIGESCPRAVDVRVLSATNRDLTREIEDTKFRSDLYFRLAAFRIRLPPLRERLEDLPLLAQRLLSQAAQAHGTRAPEIEPATLAMLCAYDWPGNVRQLQNELYRAVALAPTGVPITTEHLSEEIRANQGAAPGSPPTQAAPGDLREARASFESDHIQRMLQQCDGNVSMAARELGLSRNGLLKKIKELGLSVPGREPS